MRRHLSIGAKWALRYAVVTFVSISLLGIYVYDRIQRRILHDAELIAEIPMRNVSAAIRRSPEGIEAAEAIRVIEDAINREVGAADRDLRLGIQFFDPNGHLVLARGSLQENPLPLDSDVLGDRDSDFWEADLGESSPFYVVSARVPGGFVQTAIYGRRFAQHASYIVDGFLLALPITLLLTAGLGWFLARGSLRPIQRITATARHISGSNLDAEVPTTGSGDELDQLAVTLNEMMARIRESVARIRRFSGDAAHELRTPLAAIRSQIEVTLEKARTPEEYDQVLLQVLDEVDRLARGTDALLRLARSEAGLDPAGREPLDLRALLVEVVDFFSPLAADRDVKLELRAAEAVPAVMGGREWLHQLFANLVDNALKFTPAGGSVGVELAADPKQGAVLVCVRDTGIGIEPDQRERIFERFHKVDASRSEAGFGVGLALAREIAKAHGGSIRVESEPGRGSAFRVVLPFGS